MDAESVHGKLKDFEDACRKANLKITHQRLEIFRELAKALDHPSAETLYMRLHKKLPTLSLDTVYRTLTTFEDFGMISRVETVKSQARFEAEMSEHHHLICSKCGKITDFEWTSFREVDLPNEIDHWGSVNKKNVIVRGICNKCSSLEQG